MRARRLLLPLTISASLLLLLVLLAGGLPPSLTRAAGQLLPRADVDDPADRSAAPERAGSATLRVLAPDAPIQVGEFFTVRVRAEGVNAPLSAYQFDLTYDAALLEYRAANRGDFLSATGREVVCPEPAVELGNVRVACASTGAEAGPTDDGTVTIFTFAARGNGTSDLTLSAPQLADSSRPPALLSTTLQDGQVTVEGGPTATATARATSAPTETPTATSTAPTATETATTVPPTETATTTATSVPPTGTATSVPPTATTSEPPTATSVPPTATATSTPGQPALYLPLVMAQGTADTPTLYLPILMK